VKLPTDVNVRRKLRPGAIGPESHAPSSAVDVCVVESLLIHVTESPAFTSTGFGAYAVLVNTVAPTTMDTADPGAEGKAGSVGDVGMAVDPPQPKDPISRIAQSQIRTFMCLSVLPL
jgi:hypothetical protein